MGPVIVDQELLFKELAAIKTETSGMNKRPGVIEERLKNLKDDVEIAFAKLRTAEAMATQFAVYVAARPEKSPASSVKAHIKVLYGAAVAFGMTLLTKAVEG